MDDPSENPTPTTLDIADLQSLPFAELVARAQQTNVRLTADSTRHQIVFDLLRHHARDGVRLHADGILEPVGDNHALLRWPRFDFKPCPEDVYVAQAITRRFGLRAGQRVAGFIRAPRDRERHMTLEEVTAIEGRPPETWQEPKHFDLLTAMFPDERIILENTDLAAISPRAVDLIAPLGRGQRGLIVAPPRVGKTILLKDIARALRVNEPKSHVIILLIDERPEEVTDLRRAVNCDIFSSTFDESPARHVQLAELVSERAKRLVELGENVIILLDSITRLARGYNNLIPGKRGSRTMSGGVDSKALAKPKKFFSAARKAEEGGSLTILATALIDTQSRMDEVIFEEFKGTGNMEIHLDRACAEKRVFPAIHVMKSATRRDELLCHPDELERITLLRKQLSELPPVEATEKLIENLTLTQNNAELLLAGLR